MNNKNSINFKQYIQKISCAVWLSLLLWAICYTPVYAETKTVVAEGSSDLCFSREVAQNLARTTTDNDARRECDALGKDWRYTGNKFSGYEQCLPCDKQKTEFKCKVTQAMYICTNNQIEHDKKAAAEKEIKEKADNERAAKQAAARADEEKVAREKAEKKRAEKEAAEEKAARKKVEQEAEKEEAKEKATEERAEEKSSVKMKNKDKNSIEGAFSTMEKQITENAEAEQEREAELEKIRQQSVRITSFQDNDRVNTRVVEIKGDTQGYLLNQTLIVNFNEATQQISTNQNGQFASKVVLKAGSNAIKVCFGEHCRSLTLLADIETLALMATLTWDGKGDLDLHVETPSGDTCFYKSKHIQGVCNLDIDDTHGNNPENISIPLGALKGNYHFSIVNYDGVQSVNGVLKLYQNEHLVDTKNFVTSGSGGSTIFNVDLENYR